MQGLLALLAHQAKKTEPSRKELAIQIKDLSSRLDRNTKAVSWVVRTVHEVVSHMSKLIVTAAAEVVLAQDL